MTNPFDFFDDLFPDMPATPDFSGDQITDAPRELEVLPDGRDAIVIGDVEGAAEFGHKQGDNPWGVSGDCGVVACENILDQFGVPMTEAELLLYAAGTGLCDVTPEKIEEQGGTSADSQAALLTSYGVPAHVEYQTAESLAASIEEGHGVIAELNAGVLWNDASYLDDGGANHAVSVTGVARDPVTGAIMGFYINDSGTGNSGHFVELETFETSWSPLGEGAVVVTDDARSFDA